MATHGRLDENHAEIVAGLRACGCSVQSLADVRHGCPDLLVGLAGQTWGPYEVKACDGKLTPDERAWWQRWNGSGKVVFCLEDILEDIGLARK